MWTVPFTSSEPLGWDIGISYPASFSTELPCLSLLDISIHLHELVVKCSYRCSRSIGIIFWRLQWNCYSSFFLIECHIPWHVRKWSSHSFTLPVTFVVHRGFRFTAKKIRQMFYNFYIPFATFLLDFVIRRNAGLFFLSAFYWTWVTFGLHCMSILLIFTGMILSRVDCVAFKFRYMLSSIVELLVTVSIWIKSKCIFILVTYT